MNCFCIYTLLIDFAGALDIISWSTGPFQDECPIRTYFGQYPFLLSIGKEYNLTLTATMPSNARITYFSDDPTEVTLVRIFYTKPFAVQVFVGGVEVIASLTIPNITAGAGAFALDPQARHMTLILRGNPDPNKQVYDLRSTNIVQLTLTAKVTLAQFNGDSIVQNMALLLSIPASRIRVANVHEVVINRRRSAGVSYDIQIVDSAPVSADPVMLAMQTARLLQVVEQVQNLTSSGELQMALASIGFAVQSLVVTPPASAGSNVSVIMLNVTYSPPTTTTTLNPNVTTPTGPVVEGSSSLINIHPIR